MTVPHARPRGGLWPSGLTSAGWNSRIYLFEDGSVSSFTVTNSLNLEREVHTQRALLQAPPTVPQLARRKRGARLPRALMVTAALPHETCQFSLQVIDLTQGWSNAVTEQITHTDLLAIIAVVSIYVKLRFYTRAEVPAQFISTTRGLCSEGTIVPFQHFAANISFNMSFSKNSAYYSNWATSWQSSRPQRIDICQQRCTLRQQLQKKQYARNGKEQSQLPSLSSHISHRS